MDHLKNATSKLFQDEGLSKVGAMATSLALISLGHQTLKGRLGNLFGDEGEW